MKLILRFLKPHWGLCAITILFLIVDVSGALVISTFAAEMLNLGTSGAELGVLFATGIKMAAASLLSSICAISGGYTCAALSAKVGRDIRMALYEKSLKLSIYDFRHFGTASITTRTVSDVTTIQFALTSFVQMVLPVPVIFIVALTLAFRLDIEMGLILLAVVAVVFCLALAIMKSAAPCLPLSGSPQNGMKKRRLLLLNLRFSGFLEPFGCGLYDNKLFLIHRA